VRTQPHLIIQVVSPSTERIDRHEKLFAYRRVPVVYEGTMEISTLMG
jgi:Uma2 family endonuclease